MLLCIQFLKVYMSVYNRNDIKIHCRIKWVQRTWQTSFINENEILCLARTLSFWPFQLQQMTSQIQLQSGMPRRSIQTGAEQLVSFSIDYNIFESLSNYDPSKVSKSQCLARFLGLSIRFKNNAIFEQYFCYNRILFCSWLTF